MKRTNTAVWSEKYARWQVNVQKDGERRSFYSGTPGRAGQREANTKADAWLDSGVTTGKRMSALWELYLKKIEATGSTSHYKKIESIGRNHILPAIGTIKSDRLTEGNLQAIPDHAYKNGSYLSKTPPKEPLSKKTIINIISVLSGFIKYCRVELRALNLRPENLHAPDGARLKGKRILQPDALATLFSVDTTLRYGKRVPDLFIHAYRFQVASGLRPGEVIGLCIGDVTGDRVELRRSINVYGETTTGKNENAVRGFTMTPQAREAYDAQLLLLRDAGIFPGPNIPLFQINTECQYYKRWQRYQEANGIPTKISLYELRHTFVSIVKYLPEGQIKPYVGHSKAMDTFGVYGHSLIGDDDQFAGDVGKLFDKALS